MKDLESIPDRTRGPAATEKEPLPPGADMLDAVVEFLLKAKSNGWKIEMMHTGSFDGRGRYELTILREAPLPVPTAEEPNWIGGADEV